MSNYFIRRIEAIQYFRTLTAICDALTFHAQKRRSILSLSKTEWLDCQLTISIEPAVFYRMRRKSYSFTFGTEAIATHRPIDLSIFFKIVGNDHFYHLLSASLI
jgi:hypothetical protein